MLWKNSLFCLQNGLNNQKKRFQNKLYSWKAAF